MGKQAGIHFCKLVTCVGIVVKCSVFLVCHNDSSASGDMNSAPFKADKNSEKVHHAPRCEYAAHEIECFFLS